MLSVDKAAMTATVTALDRALVLLCIPNPPGKCRTTSCSFIVVLCYDD